MPALYELLTVRNDIIPLKHPWVLDNVDGLGVAPMRHLTQANAQQDGVTYLTTWLDPRVVTISLSYTGRCETDLWDARAELVALQAELTYGYRLRVRTPVGETYQCDLRYLAGLPMPDDQHAPLLLRRWAWQGITHDNPTLYNPEQVLIVYNMGELLGDGFPWVFPHSFGTDVLTSMSPITYPGTWRTYPIFRITGPAEDIVITNSTSDGTTTTVQTLDFGANILDAGEILTVDCTPGVKTVTHSVDGNVIDWLTDDSALGTFCILPHPQALAGVNTMNVALNGGQAATTIQVSYYNRYLGI